MRIFHNKSTNQVIFIMGHQAISFYRQNDENIVTIAQHLLNKGKGGLDNPTLCDETELPVTDESPEKPTIEQPTDSIGQIPNSPKSGVPKCEHSQKKNKKPYLDI